ncbi:hypothetical protein [Streptosporangium amethystogenes]|uniref:hypothetical protein n=1 Tax=Streptosporangium amethystogenes TaxID=2002 RepID=UPI0004C7C831|nr:hypothetical protein [Streptosporangium amethystogenes]
MSTLEDDLRRLMGDETARLRAAPDLVDRVLRSSRRRKANRVRLSALAAAVAVAGAVVPVYRILGPDSVVSVSRPGGQVAVSELSQPGITEPPAIDDTPLPVPSETADLGDLGDGRAFGRVKVGYLPDGLRWSHWSMDRGDRYTTSWNHDGDENSFYCVQIYVYEGQAVEEVEERVQAYRDEGEGEEVAVDDRTGYLLRQGVGEDGMEGTPTIILSVGEGRRVEVMFSPVYAKEFKSAGAVDRELTRIAEGLTADG